MDDPIPDEATAEPNARSSEDSTMSAITLAPSPSTPLNPTATDPFYYGWRYVTRWHNGSPKSERIPLTEWDVLHPEEDDFIMANDAHDRNCGYLKDALEGAFIGQADFLVLREHRVDWQVRGIVPHSPDVSLFDGLKQPWNSMKGTLMVKELGARPLLVIEVTSPATRKTDLNEKVREYFAVGIPFYLIADQLEAEGRAYVNLLAYRATPEGYVRLDIDPEKGVWIPNVRLAFKAEGISVACYNAAGERLLAGQALSASHREALAEIEILRQKLREAEERTK